MNTRSSNVGLFLNILSLVMLIGIGGAIDNMPPDAGTISWLLVLAETTGAVIVGVIGSKMILRANDRGS